MTDFTEIDHRINTYLDGLDSPIGLLVHSSDAKLSPYNIEQMRRALTFLSNSKVSRLIIICDNKITRLAMLLLFNLCRPKLNFSTDLTDAQRFIGLMASSNTCR